ncbi:MAG TPA: FAD-binding oxidoreductase [Anaerolineae bacterium]|nr:FAD-binding oxidoreductase [Anaerolineae bacterium]
MTVTQETVQSNVAPVFVVAGAWQDFQAGLHGQLIRPGDADYDQTRRLWNGRIDKYPAAIVRCRNTQDVVRAVNFARHHNLPVAVRAGGHNSNGFAMCDDGLVIDLSAMNRIEIEPEARLARAQPGVLIGQFIQATQEYGLVAPTGVCAGTGLGGSTLGGGTGWLMGKHGLTIDNVRSFELVTAFGQVLTASAGENADLFWGLRGGGGNFGIVTAIEYELQPLGQVLAGMVVHPLAQAKAVLRFYRQFSSAAPDDVTVYVSIATIPDLGPAVVLLACYVGDDLTEGERLLAPLRQFGSPLADLIQPMAYLDFVAMLDPVAPDGRNYYEPAYSVKQFSDEAIDTLVSWAGQTTSPFTSIIIHHIHGAATRVAADATAFALREPHYAVIHVAAWETGPAEPHLAWGRESVAAMQPFASPGLYSNFISAAGDTSLRDSYRANYDRLVALKNKYDPINFFRFNQNIKPTHVATR